MDVATSSISNIIAAGVPHAAQQARRDNLARETIPQITQNSQSANGQSVNQGAVQTAPAQTNLFIQADTAIKVGLDRVNPTKEQKSSKKEETSETKESKGAKAASSSSSATGASLSQNVTKAGAMNAALGGAFGSGVSYSETADERRGKGKGFTSRVIAKAYNASSPNYALGNSIDVRG